MKFEFKKPHLSLDFLDRISPFKPSYPVFAAEVSRKYLVLVRMRKEKDGWHLGNYIIKALPEDAVGQSIFHPEIHDREALMKVIKDALFQIGFKTPRLSLVIPDNIVRVSLLNFQEIPSNRRQLMEMIKWKLKRSIPFKLEDANISYQVLGNTANDRERVILVSLMLKSILRQYEELFQEMDMRAGLIDIATFGIHNLYRRAMEEMTDIALLNFSCNYFTFLIFRQGNMMFFRCKNYQAHEGMDEDEVMRSLKRELTTSLSYYSEKLSGKGLEKVYIRSASYPAERIVSLVGEIGLEEYEIIDPSAIVHFDGFPNCDHESKQKLTPAIGAIVGRIE
ncbi:MAG: pilus assembly protein PilM [Acidobacteriota bacterium]